MAQFTRLVRFSHNGKEHYGELVEATGTAYKVKRLSGESFETLQVTNDVIETNKLLCPLASTPLIICVGLNYRHHAEEANLTVPPYPVIFTKPADALAGPNDPIPIHPDCQSMLDYEGELTVVIGRDAKNVTADNALDYVLGYTAGNDVSARHFQRPDTSGGQFCYAKSFDAFAPIGHVITAAASVPDVQDLRLTTKINGVVKQETNTSDMIYSVRDIIAHLSRGTTLRKGTVIMTGTPSGVGYFRKEFLQDGDEVAVEIEGVGKVVNKMVYQAA